MRRSPAGLLPSLVLLVPLLTGCPNEKLTTALPPDLRIDTHQQKSVSRVDVLWVVDNSGSMAPRQENLALNFQSFISIFGRQSIDYRIAVTTTDIFRDRGALRGPVLSPASPDINARFGENIRVGTGGTSFESGLRAAELALDKIAAANAEAYAATDACKGGCSKDPQPLLCIERCAADFTGEFLRPDAFLYLVFVSDEEDFSDGDLRHYWRAYETAQGVGNDLIVTTAAIIGEEDNSCGATVGSRYAGLSALTGGELGSICDDNFQLTLKKLANSAVGLRRKFPLGVKPNEKTLEVFAKYPCNAQAEVLSACLDVDRTACAENPATSTNALCRVRQGGADGWSYEPASNLIFFAGDSVPALRSQIELHYYPEGIEP